MDNKSQSRTKGQVPLPETENGTKGQESLPNNGLKFYYFKHFINVTILVLLYKNRGF